MAKNITIGKDTFKTLYDADMVNQCIQDAFNDVVEWLQDNNISKEDVVFVALASGGNFMLHEMLLNTDYNIDYIVAKSYQGETKGALSVLYCPFDKIEGKTVVVVDDIIDTGGTIEEICRMLKDNGAAHVGKCVLCKREGNPIETINEPLMIPGHLWIAGCGMDHNGYGRMLDGIYYKI